MDMRAVVGTVSEIGLQPELVLPDQFFAPAPTGASRVPEKRLMLAVVWDAVTMYQTHARSRYAGGQRLFTEAEEWLLSDDATWPYSFVNICQALDWDVARVRRGLAHWKVTHDLAMAARCKAIGAPTLERAA